MELIPVPIPLGLILGLLGYLPLSAGGSWRLRPEGGSLGLADYLLEMGGLLFTIALALSK